MPPDALSPVSPRPGGRPVTPLVAVLTLVALVALAACTPTAPAPSQPKPTATRAAGAASPAAAAAKAAASPSVSALVSPGPRVGAQVRIADASLADATPWLSLQNTGDEALSLAAWRLEVGDRAATIPEDTMLLPQGHFTKLR